MMPHRDERFADMAASNCEIAIGIDFGTCTSVVAQMDGANAQVIVIDNDRYTERSNATRPWDSLISTLTHT